MSTTFGLTTIKFLRNHIFPTIKRTTKTAFTDKYLLYTNVSLSITLSALGDVIEQNLELLTGRIDKWDPYRTRNMAVSGSVVGLVCHNWYRFLDGLLPGYTVRIVLKKIVLDQFIGSPLYIFAFFSTCAYMEGATKGEFVDELKQKYWKLYAAEWMIWPPAQFVNFYFLSPKYRVLFDNSVSLVYDVFTSHIKYSDAGHKS